MSGGIGAISAGISETVVAVILLVLVLLLGFGAWKLWKLLMVAFRG